MTQIIRRGGTSVAAILLCAVAIWADAAFAKRAQSNDAIKQAIIRESIANYAGSCPCPYSVMRNGRSCGGRSAYSRPGGASPICFPDDVSKDDVRAYREANQEQED